MQIQPFVTSLLPQIPNLTARKALLILKTAEIVNCKGFGPSDEMKIVSSDNQTIPHKISQD